MKSKLRKPPKPTAADFLREGNASFRAGRFFLAAKAFEKARDLEPRNAAILFNLASAKERVGEIAEAAVLLTQAARQRPSWPEPAQRLAQLLGQYKLETPGDLDPHGLLACFAFDRLDQRIVAAATADYLRATTTLEKAIRDALAGDPDEAARSMILRRTDAVLSDRLLLATLAAGPVTDIGLETLLTAIRRIVLLEVTPERFEDKAFTAFLLALIRQSMANDYIFAVSDAEAAKLRELGADPQTFRADDAEQIRRLMLRLLYETPDAAGLPDMSVDDCRKIRPRGLGELLAEWQGERIRIAALAKDIPSIGAISNTVSKKVAGQYEAHPYPRWDSLQMPEESSASVA
jgi:tetratricopeptide (TPR) repeat protein